MINATGPHPLAILSLTANSGSWPVLAGVFAGLSLRRLFAELGQIWSGPNRPLWGAQNASPTELNARLLEEADRHAQLAEEELELLKTAAR